MNYKQTATDIIACIGGNENIIHLEHCSTRLRFTLADKSKVNEEALQKVPGVIGLIMSVQCQVVIGNSVVEVYDELMKLCDFDGSNKVVAKEKQKLSAVALEFIVGVFQPLVPAIAGAGVLKSILILMSTFGWMSATDTTYQILVSISDATFYFLPMMVAVTTANKLKCNRLVAIAAVGVLLLPATTKMLGEGATFMGIGLTSIAYNAQVFPAILCVSFLAILEKALNKVTPKAIRIFFVPMVALAITVPVTLMFLGPLGFNLGQGLTTIILFLYDKLGFISVALLASILPFMIAMGMHKALVPYAISTMSELGYEMLYMSASLAHNIAESGACFAVALKAKDETLKSTAASAGISALMGITEPALYGVTLQHKAVLFSVMIGSLVSGAFVGFIGLKALVVVGPGLASMSMFVDPANSMNIIYGFIGLGISILVSFGAVLVLWKEDKVDTTKTIEPVVLGNGEETTFNSPMQGTIVDLEEVQDDMFSKKALGDGFAIQPNVGELYAPADGVIKMIFDTKHAIGMTSDNGTELLFHVGLDTVQMNGKGFEAMVKVNDHVKAGDLLLKFNIEEIKKAGFDPITPVIITNTQDYTVAVQQKGNVTIKDSVLKTQRKGA